MVAAIASAGDVRPSASRASKSSVAASVCAADTGRSHLMNARVQAQRESGAIAAPTALRAGSHPVYNAGRHPSSAKGESLMAEPAVEQRVDRLEDHMVALTRQAQRTEAQVQRTEAQAQRTEAQVERTSRELAEFKVENRAFIAEMRADRKEMRREWGELANRLGTMAEDLVAPSVPRVLRTVLGISDTEPDQAVRVFRRSTMDRSLRREFDVVATCGDYMLINETKSKLRFEDITKFVTVLGSVRDFFPEHADKRVIGAIASLYVDDSIVRAGEAAGLVVLGFGEDVMDVLNSPGFVPREF
jgi:hypothetical protein